MTPKVHLAAFLRFEPILSQRVWGGTRLHTELGKCDVPHIGESWELSGVPGHISRLAGEPDVSLNDLIALHGADLLGKQVLADHGGEFPLLFKFIDAAQDLSVQVHPDDSYAQEHHQGYGKTEMWYIMHADEGARLIMGFKPGMDRGNYLKAMEKGTVAELLQEIPVKAGDAFFVPPRTIHAIGGGIVLAEIQQTSDLTYRIYDWDRMGLDGKPRELHTQRALDVMDFTRYDHRLTARSREEGTSLLKQSPYFRTNLIQTTENIERSYVGIDSFVVYMCVNGNAILHAHGQTSSLERGETLLIPARTEHIHIETKDVSILEIYVP